MPVPQIRLFDLEHLAEAGRHGIGIPATASLVIADHVLTDAQFGGKLGLGHAGFQSGACQHRLPMRFFSISA